MNLRHYILRVPFHGKVYADIFKKVVPSLTTFSFMTLFVTDYAKNAFLQDTHKNTFLCDDFDYADLR